MTKLALGVQKNELDTPCLLIDKKHPEIKLRYYEETFY